MTDKESIPVVNAHNEWDPLEEIIVGIVEGARVPPWEPVTPAVVHHEHLLDFYRQNGGQPWPQDLLDAAQKDLDEFVHILEAEGVRVRRPTPYDTASPFDKNRGRLLMFKLSSVAYCLIPCKRKSLTC